MNQTKALHISIYKTHILSLLIVLSLYSCYKNPEQKESEIVKEEKLYTIPTEETKAPKIERDSTQTPQKVDLIFTYSKSETDTLIGFCSCEKNIKKNTLKIQIRTEFPPKSELEKGNSGPTEFQFGIPRQYRFVTFYLRDSLVEDAKIFKSSTEAQFNNKKIDSISLNNYSIKINKFNYKIAQDVWGSYEVEVPGSFGYLKNDTRVKGTFHCNNWTIVNYEELHEWTVKEENYIE